MQAFSLTITGDGPTVNARFCWNCGDIRTHWYPTPNTEVTWYSM